MRIVLFLTTAMLASACQNAREPAASPPRLHLEEEFVIAAPDSGAVMGVVAEHDGRLVAWSQNGAYLLSATRAPERLPVTFAGVPAGGGFGTDGGVEFIDPTAFVMRRTAPAGESGARRLPSDLRVMDAVRTAKFGWIVAGVDQAGRYRIQPLEGAAWWVIEADTLPGGVLRPYRLAPTRDGVLLTEAEQPFRTWRVRPEGPGEVFAPTSEGYPESRGVQRWVSAPIVDLGNGMVQTLSDLGSDRRVLVLFDGDGREQRKTVLGVPMALVGVTRDGRHLVGVRDAGNPEIVLYRWRWRSNHNKGAEP